MTEAGLKAVFLAERPMLLRLLAARLGNPADAEDALQDIWLKLDQHGVPPVAQPAAYLYRMATNLAADRRIAAARAGEFNICFPKTSPMIRPDSDTKPLAPSTKPREWCV
mgnify:CR=1 FL=1